MEIAELIKEYQYSVELIQQRICVLRRMRHTVGREDLGMISRISLLYQEHGQMVKVIRHLQQYEHQKQNRAGR